MSEKVNKLWEQLQALDPVELREVMDRLRRRERGEEEPGSAGVCEPRNPKLPTDTAGAKVEPEREYDYENEGLGGT